MGQGGVPSRAWRWVRRWVRGSEATVDRFWKERDFTVLHRPVWLYQVKSPRVRQSMR